MEIKFTIILPSALTAFLYLIHMVGCSFEISRILESRNIRSTSTRCPYAKRKVIYLKNQWEMREQNREIVKKDTKEGMKKGRTWNGREDGRLGGLPSTMPCLEKISFKSVKS